MNNPDDLNMKSLIGPSSDKTVFITKNGSLARGSLATGDGQPLRGVDTAGNRGSPGGGGCPVGYLTLEELLVFEIEVQWLSFLVWKVLRKLKLILGALKASIAFLIEEGEGREVRR